MVNPLRMDWQQGDQNLAPRLAVNSHVLWVSLAGWPILCSCVSLGTTDSEVAPSLRSLQGWAAQVYPAAALSVVVTFRIRIAGGLAQLCATNHEVAPPFAIFKGWEPRTPPNRFALSAARRAYLPPRISLERPVYVDLVCSANVDLAINHGGNRELYRWPSCVAAPGLAAVV